LRGRQVVALEPIGLVAAGTKADLGEAGRTADGWLLQVQWRTGPQAGTTDWLTRGEAIRALGLLQT
jgi:hypothetical protein